MQEYKQWEKSKSGGDRGGQMGQTKDFPAGDLGSSPFCGQMFKLMF